MIRDYRNKDADNRFYGYVENPSTFPISFNYNGKRYNGFGGSEFEPRGCKKTVDGDKETTVLTFIFKEILELTVTAIHYASHGASEWKLEIENIGSVDSGIISDIRTNLRFYGENPILKGALGDHVNRYMPYERKVCDEDVHFRSDSGRATHIVFPYFNLEYGDGGALLAIGWAGTWSADFQHIGSYTSYSAKAVNALSTYLKSGEKIRTALFALIEYKGKNSDYATNLWRDWYIKHVLPKGNSDGNKIKPFSTCCLSNDTGLANSDGSISERYDTWKPSLEKMIAEDAKVDFRWFDAGWYIAPDKTSAQSYVKGHDWWDTVGTWVLDENKWPGDSFLESTEFARENGMKTLVWFEPERITDPESLSKNFGYNPDWAVTMDGTTVISNNIGNSDCFDWITDRICAMLSHNKVELYREDNNCDAAALWNHLDEIEGEDRYGITECKFIDAHYRMWDKFIDCTLGHGGCGFVDSCASGGGRNDLESMKRGIPLLRSDHDRISTAIRLSMTTSFNKWIPFCGANSKEKVGELDATGISDIYVWRASYLPVLNVDSQFVQDPNQDFDILRTGLNEWREVNPYLLKEFYTLTPWHSEFDKSGFTAYTYFDPETEKGVLFVFRQEECEKSELMLKFGFTDDRELVLRDKDSGEEFVTSASSFTVSTPEKRSAKLFFYSLV